MGPGIIKSGIINALNTRRRWDESEFEGNGKWDFGRVAGGANFTGRRL